MSGRFHGRGSRTPPTVAYDEVFTTLTAHGFATRRCVQGILNTRTVSGFKHIGIFIFLLRTVNDPTFHPNHPLQPPLDHPSQGNLWEASSVAVKSSNEYPRVNDPNNPRARKSSCELSASYSSLLVRLTDFLPPLVLNPCLNIRPLGPAVSEDCLNKNKISKWYCCYANDVVIHSIIDKR